MNPKTLELLVCPTCHGSLTLQSNQGDSSIEKGFLVCISCQATYPILAGFPRFIKEGELVGQNKKFARLYDWFSWIYSAFSRVGFMLLGTTESRARQELLSRLEPNGGRVLEVSIGPGVNLPYLVHSPAVGEIYGLDISIGQLNRCKALIKRKHWQVDLFHGIAEQLPFKDNSFSSVFHIGGINFFTDQKKAIDEMIRVAKPGSRILICDENEQGAQWYEKFLPGFKASFKGQRQEISAPIHLIPGSMQNLKLENIWNGFMYCIDFRKPN